MPDEDVVQVARIANEFAAVTVRQVETGAGRRLELRSELTDECVHLDATVLEALCGMTPSELSGLVSP
jgi:hypothetical protein